ncbi:MAG: hypothetical protein HY696_11145 [Deltaproteobacteria bacterium]|nr:hypothetical protein [Deltaproteobacteria bacterium]
MKKRITKELRERARHLTTDYGDLLASATPLTLDLKFPSPTESISIRLPRAMLNRIRMIADEQDVPYQSLIKMWLMHRLRRTATA